MALRDLLRPEKRAISANGDAPITSMRKQINRLFDDLSFGHWLDVPLPTRHWPAVNVEEDEDVLTVSADLPGMNEKDIEVYLDGDNVTLKGEKKEHTEEKKENFYRVERSYGKFERVIPLPSEVKTDETDAVYKDGVLIIKLHKTEKAKENRKKVAVKGA